MYPSLAMVSLGSLLSYYWWFIWASTTGQDTWLILAHFGYLMAHFGYLQGNSLKKYVDFKGTYWRQIQIKANSTVNTPSLGFLFHSTGPERSPEDTSQKESPGAVIFQSFWRLRWGHCYWFHLRVWQQAGILGFNSVRMSLHWKENKIGRHLWQGYLLFA